MRNSTQLEDVPELMQHIQSRLPVKEAARTSVLSKSWLRAWSTIPSLRFHVRETKHLKVVDRTLNRYLLDNIPIERFDLDIHFENTPASLVEKWIRSLATKTCLKELSLSISLIDASFTLPDEILSVAKNLSRLELSSTSGMHWVWMTTNNHPPIINCVSLREVHLYDVHISQEVLDAILSSCNLLEKIELTNRFPSDLKTIKVINLARLYELTIQLARGNTITALEISHVPNLRLVTCHLGPTQDPRPSNFCTLSLGSSVTELSLGGLITDDASLDMIKSGFPNLESLTLDMKYWTLGCFYFTCASLKRLSLMWFPKDRLIDVQVYAQKLEFFLFRGYTLHGLLFPVSTLNQTLFHLLLNKPVDTSFFLKMREALALSSNYCEVWIKTMYNEPALDIDIDDLRKRLPYPPAKNVQRLLFGTVGDECLWEHSPFFDAFFEICHPKRVFAEPDVTFRQNNHFCKLMQREVLEEKKTTRRGEYWPRYLKHVQIGLYPYWETLTNSQTNSHTRYLDELAPSYIDFKLIWC